MSVFLSTPCLSLWERWTSAARTERGNRGAMPSQSPSVTALPKGEPRGVYHGTKNGAHLPCLSLWERWPSASRTDRENRGAMPSQSPAATALPKGEPRGVYHDTKNGAHLPCLSLWERWPSKARTERGNRGAMPSQSPSVTALPEGEPRVVPFISAPPGSWYRSFPASASRPGASPAPTP